MAHRIKQIMTSHKLHRCVLCGGDKTIIVKPTAPHLPTARQVCHACDGTGYQTNNHTPPTLEMMVNYAGALEHYAIEQQAGNVTNKNKVTALQGIALQSDYENETLRRIVRELYCKPGLYLDDSDMVDTRMEPHIDFLKDAPSDMQNKMIRRSMRGFDHRVHGKIEGEEG